MFAAYLIATNEQLTQFHRIKMIRMVLWLCLLFYPLGGRDHIRLPRRFRSGLECVDEAAPDFVHVRPRPMQETGAMHVDLACAVRLHDVVCSMLTVNTRSQNASYEGCHSKLD